MQLGTSIPPNPPLKLSACGRRCGGRRHHVLRRPQAAAYGHLVRRTSVIA
jgi:hypothetical protein